MYVWAFGGGVVVISYMVTVILMVTLYLVVRNQDRSLRTRYGQQWGNGNSNHLREVRNHAFSYIYPFFLTWFWQGIRLAREFAGQESQFWLEVLATITMPLQGFFNFLVYVKIPFKNARKENKEKNWVWCLFHAIRTEPSNCSHTLGRRRSVRRRSTSRDRSLKRLSL